MKAILYARFSPRPQAEACESVEAQLADLAPWCEARKWPVAASRWDKDLSGGDRERAGLLEAVSLCRRGYALAVRDWSRLGRDTLFTLTVYEELSRRGAELWSMTDGPFSIEGDPGRKLLSVIVSAVAEWQRELIRAATSRKMREHQANGRRMSKIPPYGTAAANGKELIEVPEEIAVIARMVELRATGAGYREIGRRLAAEGITNRGGRWNHETVRDILRRAGTA